MRSNRIGSRVDLHLSLLRATQALFDARNGDVSRIEFKAFFDALDVDGNFAGLRGIGFLRLVKTGDEMAVERAILRDQGANHAIYPETSAAVANAHRAVRAACRGPAQEHRLRHVYRTGAARGDRKGDGRRRATCDRPRLLGEMTGSTQPATGFLVFVRLNVDTAPEGINAARRHVAGFLYAAFRRRICSRWR